MCPYKLDLKLEKLTNDVLCYLAYETIGKDYSVTNYYSYTVCQSNDFLCYLAYETLGKDYSVTNTLILCVRAMMSSAIWPMKLWVRIIQ